ncbi:hypothetical protein XAB3213_230002 [Xanthomonas citri pv. bilvae]|nr:hypothetical protein XAB3213_230002 [Xanthomonas citri pv. bilvae]
MRLSGTMAERFAFQGCEVDAGEAKRWSVAWQQGLARPPIAGHTPQLRPQSARAPPIRRCEFAAGPGPPAITGHVARRCLSNSLSGALGAPRVRHAGFPLWKQCRN